MLRMTFDGDADALYLTLRGGEVAQTEELDDWAYVDVDTAGQAIGIEVIHPARDWPVQEAISRYGITGDDRELLEAMFPSASSGRIRGFTTPNRVSASAQAVCVAA